MENTRCVSQPNCNHYACINCFKRCYYGKYVVFPYPEIENNSKWNEYRCKIDEYEILFNKIEDENNNETVINKCPLCRK